MLSPIPSAPAPVELLSDTTLADAKRYVQNAMLFGGGWLQIYTHHVCDDCGEYSVSPHTLSAFLDWLGDQNVDARPVAGVLDPSPPSIAVGDLATSPRGVTPIVALPETSAAIKRVRFFVDGEQIGSRTSPPWTRNWRAAPGDHQVSVLLEDAETTAAASRSVTFTAG